MPKHNPYNIKIELVRGCTLRCPFCALPEMDWADSDWEFMEESIYKKIVDDISEWLPKVRIEFAERGEQSFHPQLKEFIEYMRLKVPKAQITLTTNGDTIREYKEEYPSWIQSLLDAGLNFAMIDCYSQKRYDKFKTLFEDSVRLYEDNVNPYTYIGPHVKTVLLVDGTHHNNHIIRRWHNVGGSANVVRARDAGYDMNDLPDGVSLKSMCVHPFREIEIHYDGTVPICCVDWKEEAIVGNVKEMSLQEIWIGLDKFRKPLLLKRRDLQLPCAKCSERAGFRVGLEMGWFK